MGILSRILIAAGCLLFGTALVASLVNAVQVFGSGGLAVSALLAAIVSIVLCIHFVCRHLNRTLFLTISLALGFMVRMAWILWNQAPPSSDFLFMYNAALNAAAGDYGFTESDYYISFPYQLGFTMYESIFIRWFSDPIFALKIMNVLFSLGTAVLLYLTAKRVLNENCARIAALLYLFYVPNILMCSVLTNQHLSIFLFMTGCLLLLRSPKLAYYAPLAGLCLGLANLARPIGIVYLAAILAFFVAVRWRQWLPLGIKRNLPALGRLAAVFAVFYFVQFLASFSLMAADVTNRPLSGGDRYWKFMVGLNAQTNGAWSLEDAKYANQFPFGEERHRAELAKIKERLANETEIAALLGRKLVSMWGSADSSAYWSLMGTNDWKLERLLNKWERPLYVFMCAFGLIAMLSLWRLRSSDEFQLYLLVLLLYAGVHLLIENQSRYRFDLIPVMILLQSYGAYRFYDWVRKLRLPLPSRFDNKRSFEA